MKRFILVLWIFSIISFGFAQSVNLNQALELKNADVTQLRSSGVFSKIKIENLTTFEKSFAGSYFKNKASARFIFLDDNIEIPIANADIIIAYPKQKDTEIKTAYTTLKTDSNGELTFSLSTFEYPMLSKVRFILNFFEFNENSPLELEVLNDEELSCISTSFPVMVAGKKRKSLKVSIDIVDFTKEGYPYSRNMVATSLLGEFMRRGYLWPGNYSSTIMRNLSIPMESIIPKAHKDFAGNVKDFIFGRSQITKSEKCETSWQAICEATIQIWDMEKNLNAKTINCKTSAKGKTEAEATMNARKNLGEKVLADLIEYGYEFH